MDHDKPSYVSLKNRPPSDRPRERLWQIGAEKLSNAELLAILIRTGTEGRSAIQVAEDLLSQTGGVHQLAQLSPSEIRRTKGMGHANTAALVAALELSRRAHQPQLAEKIYLHTTEDVACYFRRQYKASTPEKFVALFINKNHLLLGDLEVSRGGSNAVVVNPQRVFKEALLLDAKAVILAHNHPGGNVNPTPQDISLTGELQSAGELFRIPVVEHVIVTPDEHTGFADLGLLLQSSRPVP